jgi:phosphoglycolate phosphatase-like HAD superfamily hydrolase
MNWCLANCQNDSPKILSREEYRAIVESSDVELPVRTNLIYATRNRFIEADIERWLALHQAYQPLWNELTQRENDLFVILTNKNHDATVRLCRHFGLNIEADLFVILTNKNHDATVRLCRHFGLNIEAGNIYSGDNSTTKIENMLRIQERFGRQPYVFIDDSVLNLKELDSHFNRNTKILSFVLAAWGYLGAGDTRSAPEIGFPAFQQADLIKLLDDF